MHYTGKLTNGKLFDTNVKEEAQKGAQKEAEIVLLKHKNLLEKVAKDLVEKEIIEREEFEKLIGVGKNIKKP